MYSCSVSRQNTCESVRWRYCCQNPLSRLMQWCKPLTHKCPRDFLDLEDVVIILSLGMYIASNSLREFSETDVCQGRHGSMRYRRYCAIVYLVFILCCPADLRNSGRRMIHNLCLVNKYHCLTPPTQVGMASEKDDCVGETLQPAFTDTTVLVADQSQQYYYRTAKRAVV